MRGRFFRTLCNVAGVDHDRIQTCPLGDKQFATRVGLNLLFSSAFLFSIFASSLLIGFGDDLVSDSVVITMAFVTAGVVLLVDIQIVQSDFYQHGLELARDRGLDDQFHLLAKIRRPATVALRLTLSMTIAFAFATFFELRLFGADIKRQIESDNRKANASLFQEIETAYDASVKLIEADRSREEATLSALNRYEAEIRGKLFGTSAIDREIADAVQKLQPLTAAKQAADIEALRREGDAVNELNGIRETADQSGMRGAGSRYRTAIHRATLARQESTRLAAEIKDVQVQISGLRDRRDHELEKTNGAVNTELRNLNVDVGRIRLRFDALSKKLEQAVANRESTILAIAQLRPEYTPKTDGFLLRVEALETLKERPAVARIALWTMIVIMAVEVSAVIGKVFFSTPTLYAVRTALEFENSVVTLVAAARDPAQDAEAASIRKDIEIEELRREFAAKRASRLSKEAALQQFYSESNDNNRSTS